MSVLTAKDLEELRPYLEEVNHPPGTVLLHQGEPGRVFHIIVSGQVDVLVVGERRVRVATLGSGDFIGEMSCLTGDPVSANVEALDDVVTYSVDRPGLLRLIDLSPVMREFLFGALIKRVKNSNQRVQEENQRVSAISQTMLKEGEGRYGELVGKSPAMQAARERLAELAPAKVPVAILGEPGTGKRHAAARLHYEGPQKANPLLMVEGRAFEWAAWERQYQAAEDGTLILTHADLVPDELLHRALRGEGRVRLVFTAKSLPDLPGVQIVTLPSVQERREDIPLLARHFLRKSGSGDPDTGLSGEALRHLMIFPYLDGNVKELERVVGEASVLAGHEPIRTEHLRLGAYRAPGTRPRIGLALGSGAVRGGAHLGVIKVLESEGFPIDLIAGTSAGAMAGALYATGMGVDMVAKNLLNTRWRDLIKFRWSNEAIFDSSVMVKTFERIMGPINFEDLKIPFAAIAADAKTGEPVVLRTGPLAPAIRASAAIPMLMKPVLHQGKTLIDGGVVHKVPAIVARSMGADMVIGVNVSAPSYVSGPPRNLFEALMNAFDITSERLTVDELEWADIVIIPNLSNLSQQLRNTPAFIAKGEEAARLMVPQIRKRYAQLAEGMG